MPWKVEHYKDICIGCGACAAIDPENWVMNGDKSDLLQAKANSDGKTEHFELIVADDKLGAHMDAAKSCPVPCIFVKKV